MSKKFSPPVSPEQGRSPKRARVWKWLKKTWQGLAASRARSRKIWFWSETIVYIVGFVATIALLAAGVWVWITLLVGLLAATACFFAVADFDYLWSKEEAFRRRMKKALASFGHWLWTFSMVAAFVVSLWTLTATGPQLEEFCEPESTAPCGVELANFGLASIVFLLVSTAGQVSMKFEDLHRIKLLQRVMFWATAAGAAAMAILLPVWLTDGLSEVPIVVSTFWILGGVGALLIEPLKFHLEDPVNRPRPDTAATSADDSRTPPSAPAPPTPGTPLA